ncbi:phage tail tape measure protein [Rhodoplanes azumiensis]|uniref:Phage tail tape measure protein n=1 Tax=Rhodoplanes azumiensis TaxID=1897628 RepID=A0ABW5ARU0_9BRAD
MAARSAEIVIKLVDQASGPAKNIAAALRGVQAAAKGVNGTLVGRRGLGAAAARDGGLMPIAPNMRMLLGGVGGYALGRQATRGFKEYADTDRMWSRIATTAEASAEKVAEARRQVIALAGQYGIAQADATKGFEALIAQGMSLTDAVALMRPIVATAQASGATTEDVAKSAGAMASNLKISAREMQIAFDRMAYAGKAGQFELRDMAAFIPSLAAAWNNAGQTGVDSLSDLFSTLQIVRKQTGNSEQAFNGVRDLLAKVFSKDVQKNFREAGVDLEEGLKKGQKEGRNLFDVIAELTEKATKGDLSQLPKFFGEIDSRNAVSAIIRYRQERQKLREDIRTKALGTVDRDVITFTNDAAASIQRLSDSWSAAWASMGRAADAAGVSTMLGRITDRLNAVSDALNKVATPEGRAAADRDLWRQHAEQTAEHRARAAEENARRIEERLAAAEREQKAGRPFAKWTADRLRGQLETARLERERARLDLEALRLQQHVPVITKEDEALQARRAELERRRSRVPGLTDPKIGRATPLPPTVPPMGFDDSAPAGAPGRSGVRPAAPFTGTTPAAAPRPGVVPAVPIEKVRELGAAADDAGRKLDRVGAKTVAPTISLAGIEEANRQLAEFEARMNRLSGMRASPVVAPRIAPAPAAAAGGGGAKPAAGSRTAWNSLSDYPRRV